MTKRPTFLSAPLRCLRSGSLALPHWRPAFLSRRKHSRILQGVQNHFVSSSLNCIMPNGRYPLVPEPLCCCLRQLHDNQAANHGAEAETLRTYSNAVKVLLDTNVHPVGDFTPDCLFEVEDMMPFWLQLETPESVRTIFQLMDRLDKEQKFRKILGERFKWINTQFLEDVIRVWYNVSSRHVLVDFSPQTVFSMVQSYLRIFRHLEWTTFIAYHIGAAHAFHSNQGVIDPLFCEKLVDLTIKEWKETNKETAYPTPELFSPAVSAWSRTVNSKTTSRLSDTNATLPTNAHPIHRIENLLETMEGFGLKPNTEIYESCIRACARFESQDGAQRALSFLENMIDTFHSSGHESRTWSNSFCAAIQAFALAKEDSSAVIGKIDIVVSRYTELHKTGAVATNDNSVSVYNAAIESMSMIGTEESAQKAGKFFRELKRVTLPDDKTWFSLVLAWSKAGCHTKAKFIVSTMPSSSFAGYFGLLKGMSASNHPQLFGEAENVLQLLSDSGTRGGPRAGTRAYNEFLACVVGTSPTTEVKWLQKAIVAVDVVEFLRLSWSNGESDRRPDRDSYAHVIRCWAMHGHPDLAMHWLGEMRKDFYAGRTTAAPLIEDCNHVLYSFVKCSGNDAAKRAVAFVQSISTIESTKSLLRPDEKSYELVLTCLKNKGGTEAAEEAEKLLTEMSDVGLRPNKTCYNLVLNCWVGCSLPDRAEDILNRMVNGGGDVVPDVLAFNSCLSAWSNSAQPDAAQRCERLLSRMMDLRDSGFTQLQPDLHTYVALMKVYARSGQADASARAAGLFNNILKLEIEDSPLNREACDALLRVWSNSDDPRKHDIVRSIVHHVERVFRSDTPLAPSGSQTGMHNHGA
ncbi:hypothetical protein ACA910_022277 [Epithemia clementina (nom. ined.)]